MSALAQLNNSVVISLNEFLAHAGVMGTAAGNVAVYGIYLLPLIWVVWWFVAGRRQREYLLSAMFAGILGWQVLNRVLKLFYFEPRPLYNNLPVKEVFFARPENSFPSDHAAFLGGIALFFVLQKQRRSALWLTLFALLVCTARVGIAAHYPSDILVGYVDGFIAAWIVSLLHRWLTETVWAPLIRFAHRIHLA